MLLLPLRLYIDVEKLVQESTLSSFAFSVRFSFRRMFKTQEDQRLSRSTSNIYRSAALNSLHGFTTQTFNDD